MYTILTKCENSVLTLKDLLVTEILYVIMFITVYSIWVYVSVKVPYFYKRSVRDVYQIVL